MTDEEERTRIDKSNEGISELNADFFFNFQFLVELNLSNNEIMYLPRSISQCFLLERVDITFNPMNKPPPVLFSLPYIRAHPENLFFGQNLICSRSLMLTILSEIDIFNQCIISFANAYGQKIKISIAPDTTLMEFLLLVHPEFRTMAQYLFIVRRCQGTILRLSPDCTPICLYDVPNAEFSIELKFIPPDITDSSIMLIKSYIKTQAEIFTNDTELQDIASKLDSMTAEHIINSVDQCQKLNCKYFVTKLIDGTELTIIAQEKTVTICSSPLCYHVFALSSIKFSYVDSYYLLVCDKKALVLDPSSISSLLPLFSLAAPIFKNPVSLVPSKFIQLGLKAIMEQAK